MRIFCRIVSLLLFVIALHLLLPEIYFLKKCWAATFILISLDLWKWGINTPVTITVNNAPDEGFNVKKN